MTWFDRSRRALSVLLATSALVVLPSVAFARFSGADGGGITVGTDRMELPTAVTGSYRCTATGNAESFDLTVASFTDTGPAGATYRYELLRGSSLLRTQTGTTRSQTLSSGSVATDGTATTWSVTVQATLGGWTGPVYTKSVTCPGMRTASGTF